MSTTEAIPQAEAIEGVRATAEEMRSKGARLMAVAARDNGDGTFELIYLYDVGGRMQDRRFNLLPDQEVDTISGIYAGATNMERENVDLFGLKFKGMSPGLLLEAGKSPACPLRKTVEKEMKEGPGNG